MKRPDAGEMRAWLEAGAISSAELVATVIERSQAPGCSGKDLNAVLYLNEGAAAIAAALDSERRAGALRGPLHGIPVMLKASIDTGDAMPTTAGSAALHGRCAAKDADIVARLREAGAIIVGKTNMSEWANFRSRHSSSGWSSEGGQTRNPWALDRSPSGSSSGSAVVVAAGICPLAVGTETDGSIVSPASMNGVVGIKPERGRLSGKGIIPVSSTQDTAGPLALTVRDAVLLLDAMSPPGTQPLAPLLDSVYIARGRPGAAGSAGSADRALAGAGATHWSGTGGSGRADNAGSNARQDGTFAGPIRLDGLRLGYAARLGGFHPGTDALMRESLDLLRSLGAVIVETDLVRSAELARAESTVMLYECARDLDRYLAEPSAAGSPETPRSLAALVAWNDAHAASAMPFFGQDLLMEALETYRSVGTGAYLAALDTCDRLARREGLDRQMTAFSIDALLAPSGAPAWKIDHIDGDHYLGGSAGYPAIAGYPNVSVPAGLVSGLPVGLSIMGPPAAWPAILRVALAFEAARGPMPVPGFAESVDVN